MTAASGAWATLERWSATVFLVAGGVWLIDTAPYVLELFTGTSIPEALNGALLLAVLLLTQVGVLGSYRSLADEVPRLALVGTLLTAVSGVVILGAFAWVVGAGVIALSMPPVGLLVAILLLTLLALLLFGFGSVRADVPSRACGVLVLVLAATWIVWVAGIVGLLGPTPDWASAALGMLFTALMLSIGAVVHLGGFPLHRTVSSRRPTLK